MKRPEGKRRKLAEATNLYLWHLREPFVGPDSEHNPQLFDHSAWWEDSGNEVTRVAALWEVFRRHPRTLKLLNGRLEAANSLEPVNDLDWFLCDHALSSWVNLARRSGSGHEREGVGRRQKRLEGEWIKALQELPPQKGFDGRPCVSVTLKALDTGSGANPNAALVLDRGLHRKAKTDPESQSILEMATEVHAREVGRLAEEQHREGRIIIAIAPDISNLDDAMKLFQKCYRAHWKAGKKGKGRMEDWFAVIRKFEAEELDATEAKTRRDPQLFARFRRVIGKVEWPMPVTESV